MFYFFNINICSCAVGFPQQSENNRGLCCAYSYLESIEVHIKCTLHALKHLKHSKPINLLTKYPPQFDFFLLSSIIFSFVICRVSLVLRTSVRRGIVQVGRSFHYRNERGNGVLQRPVCHLTKTLLCFYLSVLCNSVLVQFSAWEDFGIFKD